MTGRNNAWTGHHSWLDITQPASRRGRTCDNCVCYDVGQIPDRGKACLFAHDINSLCYVGRKGAGWQNVGRFQVAVGLAFPEVVRAQAQSV
jgi:hypothetical protein